MTVTQSMKDKAIAYKALFANDDGNKILHDLMDFCYLLSTTKPSETTTEADAWKNEGRREVILYILHHLNVDLTMLTKLISDKAKKEQEYVTESSIDFKNTY